MTKKKTARRDAEKTTGKKRTAKKTTATPPPDPAAAEAPAAAEKPPAEPKRKKHDPHADGVCFGVVLKKDMALGNGNRLAGEKLGTLVCEPGVEVIEIVNALRNPMQVGIK